MGTRGFWQQMPARLTFSLSLPPSILPSIPSSHPLETGSVPRVFASAFSAEAADVSFRVFARHTKATRFAKAHLEMTLLEGEYISVQGWALGLA